MMRIPTVAEAEESNSMSAMTDVVFLLLIFFIVTMSAYVEMTLLETSLPTASGTSAEIDLQNSVKIELAATGETIISGVSQSRETFLTPPASVLVLDGGEILQRLFHR
jgi:biopolymer transport protein ExbD